MTLVVGASAFIAVVIFLAVVVFRFSVMVQFRPVEDTAVLNESEFEPGNADKDLNEGSVGASDEGSRVASGIAVPGFASLSFYEGICTKEIQNPTANIDRYKLQFVLEIEDTQGERVTIWESKALGNNESEIPVLGVDLEPGTYDASLVVFAYTIDGRPTTTTRMQTAVIIE